MLQNHVGPKPSLKRITIETIIKTKHKSRVINIPDNILVLIDVILSFFTIKKEITGVVNIPYQNISPIISISITTAAFLKNT